MHQPQLAILHCSNDWRESKKTTLQNPHDARVAAICLSCKVPYGCDSKNPLCGLPAADRDRMR